LIQWTIEFAQTMKQFDETFVSTDSDEIAACCESAGCEVHHRRPQHLATDTASSVDVALQALETVEASGKSFDLIALLQPTTPVRERAPWEEAFRLIDDGSCDAVVGVSRAQTHPYHVFRQLDDDRLVPWSERSGLALRSQELPPAVSVCGALYLIRATALREARTFFPEGAKGVVCREPYECIDIDTEADWVTAEALVRHYGKTP
jgi:CMP-N,N'-diacetyllegionaminic acid synthase